MMADVLGRCRELDYCSIGQMRTLVRIPLGRPFVCPECGKPLREPVLMNRPLSRKRIAWWTAGTLGAFVLLYEWVAPSGRHRHLPLATVLPPAQVVPVPRPPAPPAAAPAAPVLRSIAPIPPAPIPVVLGPPVPTPLDNAPLIRMPPALPADVAKAAVKPASAVRVTMECTVDAAGVPSNCTPAHVQEPPPPAPRPKPAPPPPADRQPSALPVAGGGPAYPSDYVRDGRAGEVTVDCIIDPTGEPEHCHVRDIEGGRRFAEATVDWLNSGTVRFAPALRNGVPVAEEHRWRIAFPPH
jgi:hypothetical protein